MAQSVGGCEDGVDDDATTVGFVVVLEFFTLDTNVTGVAAFDSLSTGMPGLVVVAGAPPCGKF